MREDIDRNPNRIVELKNFSGIFIFSGHRGLPYDERTGVIGVCGAGLWRDEHDPALCYVCLGVS